MVITSSRSSTKFNRVWLFLFFLFFNLTYSRWTSSLPSCLWSQRISPSLPGSRLTTFYRDDASLALLQLVNQWLNTIIILVSMGNGFACTRLRRRTWSREINFIFPAPFRVSPFILHTHRPNLVLARGLLSISRIPRQRCRNHTTECHHRS